MRFITEFQLDNGSFLSSSQIENKHRLLEYEIGPMIGEYFGWQYDGNKDGVHHKLEIEAFPMDKWVEFRDKIRRFVVSGETDVTKIWLSILELESFGNPAGGSI